MRIFLRKKATGERITKQLKPLVIHASSLEEAAAVAHEKLQAAKRLEREKLSSRWQLAAAAASDRRLLVGVSPKVSTSYKVGKRNYKYSPKLGIGNY